MSSTPSPDDALAPSGPWTQEEVTYLRWAYSHSLSARHPWG
ncbi:MAG: hypothetical protein ACE5LS_04320 [Thermoplasmata archaeon]